MAEFPDEHGQFKSLMGTRYKVFGDPLVTVQQAAQNEYLSSSSLRPTSGSGWSIPWNDQFWPPQSIESSTSSRRSAEVDRPDPRRQRHHLNPHQSSYQ